MSTAIAFCHSYFPSLFKVNPFDDKSTSSNHPSHLFFTVYTNQAFTSVTINVLDTNDLSPLFYQPSYVVSVPEDKPLHAAIVKVSASDADIGINGEIYYSFLEKTDVFSIHPTTGVVSLTRHLDYSKER